MAADIPAMHGDVPVAPDSPRVISLACAVSVDALLHRVVLQLEQRGLELFAVIDHSGAAAAVGLTMPGTKVVMFGNPKGGTPLMVSHPLIALDLPLKLLIWETKDGKTFVSYNAPSYLAVRFALTERESAVVQVAEAIALAVVSD
jgi:uncharacterized protein (DUF302 family)